MNFYWLVVTIHVLHSLICVKPVVAVCHPRRSGNITIFNAPPPNVTEHLLDKNAYKCTKRNTSVNIMKVDRI